MKRPADLIALIVLLGAAAIGPLVLLAVWSVSNGWLWPDITPRGYSLRAWEYVFSSASTALPALGTSTGLALTVATASVLLALPAAKTLARHPRFTGRNAIFALLLLPVAAPPLASTLGLHRILLAAGLTDTLAGVALAHLVPALPYATLLLVGSFRRFDPALEALARTLGASPLRVWWSVILPGIAPGLATAFLLAFLVSWGQYLITLVIGGGRVVTLPLELVAFQRGGDDGITAALSLIFVAPCLLAAFVGTRWLRPLR